MDVRRRFTFEQLRRCAEREVVQRRRVYLRLVAQGKMNGDTAEKEIAMMEAIAEFMKANEQPELPL